MFCHCSAPEFYFFIGFHSLAIYFKETTAVGAMQMPPSKVRQLVTWYTFRSLPQLHFHPDWFFVFAFPAWPTAVVHCFWLINASEVQIKMLFSQCQLQLSVSSKSSLLLSWKLLFFCKAYAIFLANLEMLANSTLHNANWSLNGGLQLFSFLVSLANVG